MALRCVYGHLCTDRVISYRRSIVVTDRQRNLHLARGSPADVKSLVVQAVRIWRWRNICRVLPQLDLGTRRQAAVMEPIFTLRRVKRNYVEWSPKLSAYFMSVISGRQWLQRMRVKRNDNGEELCFSRSAGHSGLYRK